MAAQSAVIRGLAVLVGLLSLSCVGLAGRVSPAPGARVSELASRGDPRRQASQRLVIEGLDADASGQFVRASSRYEQALRLDAGNPWAYLALARHHVEVGDARVALTYLDQAETLFEGEDADSPGAETLCLGLRGQALALLGRDVESRALLDEAARRDPAVWGDRHLSAQELR